MTLSLLGKQIVIRDWEHADLAIFREFMRPGKEWQRFDGPYYARPSEDDTDKLIEKIAERIENASWPTPRQFAVIADSVSNEMIGRVSWYWQSEETRWLSAGLVIYDEASWGRGLGHEALGLWTEHLFDAMPDITRLDLRTWSGNPGMMRLAEKLGYQQEARFRNARVVEGKLYDGLGYGVLREEWSARYPDRFSASL